MSEKTQTSSGGIGFFGLLTLLFIGLKLTGYIDWSWWLVFGPLWIPFAVVFGVIGIIFLFIGLAAIIASIIASIIESK